MSISMSVQVQVCAYFHVHVSFYTLVHVSVNVEACMPIFTSMLLLSMSKLGYLYVYEFQRHSMSKKLN